MSRNDQLLVKEYNGEYYVFDVMAESWGEWKGNKFISGKNKLNISQAKGVFNTREEAHDFARKLDEKDDWGGSEYGIVDEVLYKDGAKVVIVK
jgi:hypothetical protein